MWIYQMYVQRDCVFLSAHSQFGRIFSLELQIAIKRVQRIYERSCCMVVLYGYCFWTKKFYQILMDIEKDKMLFLRPEDINVRSLRVFKQVLKFPLRYNELYLGLFQLLFLVAFLETLDNQAKRNNGQTRNKYNSSNGPH